MKVFRPVDGKNIFEAIEKIKKMDDFKKKLTSGIPNKYSLKYKQPFCNSGDNYKFDICQIHI